MAAAPLKLSYRFFALSIFLSAFLLFAIQPIASKHLLPYFGGSSSVWATSLVFFTAVLFFGYAYVYFLTSRPSRQQMIIHGSITILAVLASALALLSWGSLYPPLDWITRSELPPAFRVLAALALSVGVPYFLLSTTGPLLQYWYGVSSEKTADDALSTQSDSSQPAISKSPYALYAISNAGSLIALVAYPFFIEPNISLPREEMLWIVLFFVYAVLLAAITLSVRNVPPHIRASAEETGSYARKVSWILYAALPAFLLVATTTVLTQLISSVPLLWVVPLTLYLLTFILAFSGLGATRFMPLFVLLAAFAAYLYTPALPKEIVQEVTAYLVFLFFACLMCHAQLYRLRPGTAALPFFYLCTSFGGVVGTVCASLLAPILFNNFFEFPLGLTIAASLALVLLHDDFYPRLMRSRTILAIRIIVPCLFVVMLTNMVTADVSINTISSRNFYGAVQVKFEGEATVLQNGTTMHGLQATEKEWSYVPSTYYTQSSGVGRAIRAAREQAKDGAVRVGVVGLGTGTIAAYCEEKDTFTFYEIDPHIEDIARRYFSYLARCSGSSVHIGDGRLSLHAEAASEKGYDVLAVDAFTDDAIPAHLLTKEAVQTYINSLSSERGIVAIHTSNRFLVLYPVLLSIARESGLNAMVVNDGGDSGYLGSGSQWVLLSRDAQVFNGDAFIGVTPWPAVNPLPAPWTDSYTSLFTVLDVQLPF